MATLWDHELSGEFDLVGQLTPRARLDLARRLLEWTIGALPARKRWRLLMRGRRTVNAAMDLVRTAAAGSPVDVYSPEVESLEDRLQDLVDDFVVQDLAQLFSALSFAIGMPPGEFSAGCAGEVMSACYDVIRDCADLPELPLGTPESTVLDLERANADCMRAIEVQRQLVREAVRRRR